MGNWPDEVEQRDIHHLGHRSGGREAVWVIVLICGPGFIVLLQSDLSGIIFYFLGAVISAVGAISGVLVMHWIGGMEERERASMAAEVREERAREKERQIAEMKARQKGTGSE